MNNLESQSSAETISIVEKKTLSLIKILYSNLISLKNYKKENIEESLSSYLHIANLWDDNSKIYVYDDNQWQCERYKEQRYKEQLDKEKTLTCVFPKNFFYLYNKVFTGEQPDRINYTMIEKEPSTAMK